MLTFLPTHLQNSEISGMLFECNVYNKCNVIGFALKVNPGNIFFLSYKRITLCLINPRKKFHNPLNT